MNKKFVELVYDEEEFLDIVDKSKRLHYEVTTKYYHFSGIVLRGNCG